MTVMWAASVNAALVVGGEQTLRSDPEMCEAHCLVLCLVQIEADPRRRRPPAAQIECLAG